MSIWVREVIPLHLMSAERALDFARWLRGLPLPAEDKKQIVIAWVEETGVPLSADLVLQAGAR